MQRNFNSLSQKEFLFFLNLVVNKKTVIVVNKHKPIEQRLKTLANSFLEFDLDKVYLVPAVRAYIEEQKTLER